jgi:hypothetical protein
VTAPVRIVLVGGPSDGAEHTIDVAWLREAWPQFQRLPEPQLTLGNLDGRGGELPIQRIPIEQYGLMHDAHGQPSRDDMGRLRFRYRGEW